MADPIAQPDPSLPEIPTIKPPGSEFLLDPDGQIVQGSSEMVPMALQSGYQMATPQNVAEVRNQKTYGEGVGNQIESALLGAGEGATFGLSTLALTKGAKYLGFDDPTEAIKQIEERNPISHGVGEVGGILGSSLLPGAGLVGSVSKLGNAISEGTANIAGKGLAALTDIAPNAQKVLNFASQVGSKAMGSAVEGALYGGIGNSITEAALGDPDLNAEKIMSNFGYGALIGGRLGGSFKASELAIPKAWNGAKTALGKLYELSVGNPGEEPGILSKAFAKTSSAISGKSADDILTGIKNRASVETNPEALNKLGSQLTDNLGELRSQVRTTLDKTIEDIHPHEISNLLDGIPLEKTAFAGDQAASFMQNSIAKMIADPTTYPKASITEMQQFLDGFLDDMTKQTGGIETSTDLFNSLNGLKSHVEGLKLGNVDAASEFHDVSNSIGKLLNDSDVWGSAAARQSSLSSAQKSFERTQEQFDKLFVSKVTDQIDPDKVHSYLSNMQSPANSIRGTVLKNYFNESQNVLGEIQKSYENAPNSSINPKMINDLLAKQSDIMSDVANTTAASEAQTALKTGHESALSHIAELGAWVNMPGLIPVIYAGKMLANPGMAISRLAHMESVVNKVTNSIEKGTKGIFSAASSGLDATEGLISQKLSYEKLAADHMKFSEQLNNTIGNPEGFLNRVTDATHPIYQAAPNTATALNMTAARAANFLQSKLPPSDTPTGPFEQKQKPSQAEISMFDRYRNVVENPLDIMNQVKNDSITPQAIEAVSTVYPRLYDKIKGSVMEHIASMTDPSEIPYQTKLSLSMLMGEPLDKSMRTDNIATNLSLYKAAENEKQAANAPKKKTRTAGLSKITLADRSQTTFQQAASRQS